MKRLLLLALIAGAAVAATPKKPWLGMALTLRGDPGGGKFLYVVQVADQTPARAAGMAPGDLITAINGKHVQFRDQLAVLEFMSTLNPGDKVTLRVTREGQARDIRMRVGTLPDDYLQAWQEAYERARAERNRSR